MKHTLRNIAIVLAAIALPLCIFAQSRTVSAGKPAARERQGREDRDSLVRLISADSLMLLEVNGETCRKVVGNPVRFFHNNTWLLCDTAIWNVDQQVINAFGKVKIEQDRTCLTSDRLNYYVERDLAEFRGSVVQLTDKDKNTLKTHYLDYNTKDSVAVFRNGASMRDKDGQIIESMSGTYDSKAKTFVFTEDVNMYTDSIFVKTTYLRYESELSLATFGYNTHAWQEDNMLSANAGTYDRGAEEFFFHRDVHVMTASQEAWSDSLTFNRQTRDVMMEGNAQITDTTRSVHALAGRIEYADVSSLLTMTREPAIVAEIEDKEGRDSVWVGAEMIQYWTVKKCDVDSVENAVSAERIKSISVDPVSELRRQTAEAAAKAAEEAAANDPNNAAAAAKRKSDYEKSKAASTPEAGSGGKARVVVPEKPARIKFGKKSDPQEVADTVSAEGSREVVDTASVVAPQEVVDSTQLESSDGAPKLEASPSATDAGASPSATDAGASPSATDAGAAPSATDAVVAPDETESALDGAEDGDRIVAAAKKSDDEANPADSVAVAPPDTTKMGFVSAVGNVKVFRETMQVRCDSLRYCDLDSLARLYKEPKIWNETTHQYIADSVYVVIRNNSMEKANLMSNAFIHIQEDTLHYDQIRATEMVAYFDENGQLERFDGLGGALALFYIEENDALATVNKKDAKMISAVFSDGSVQRVYYFQEAKSDAYPVVQMSREDQTIKGFAWTPQDRPKSRYVITPLSFRSCQRKKYENVPQAAFYQTEIYFPGYMDEVHRQIEIRDSLKLVRERERAEAKRRAEEQARLDALAAEADSLAAARDSLLNESLQLPDMPDSLMNSADSLAAGLDSLYNDLDSLATVADSLASLSDSLASHQLSKEEAKAAAKAEKKAQAARKREERLAARDAKWAAKDEADSLKQARKDEKKAAKLRAKKAKALRAQEKQAAKDQATLEKYIERYEKKKARRD